LFAGYEKMNIFFQTKNIKLSNVLKKKTTTATYSQKKKEFPDLEGVENLFLEMLIFFANICI